MRSLLIFAAIVIVYSANLNGQRSFYSFDKESYDYFMRGDYKNLRRTADSMLSQGIDYYYLRLRLGILGYNKQMYSKAFQDFKKALEFNSLDTISREYIYYSFLFSGRDRDADLYVATLDDGQKNNFLKSVETSGIKTSAFIGSSVTGYNVSLYNVNSLDYEAVKSSYSLTAGIESRLSRHLKATFAYTNFGKNGTVYSALDSTGATLNYNQNQVYAKLTGFAFSGWEFSGFGEFNIFSEKLPVKRQGFMGHVNSTKTEYLGGLGISKNGWKIHTGFNISLSNFGNSNQFRSEGYLTFLPLGNLKLYLTLGGMYQNDTHWGDTYQYNGELGIKLSKKIWIESGIMKGNSFLYARNQGYSVNNSYLIPANLIYCNFIFLPGKHLNITVTPYYADNQSYSWNLKSYYKVDRITDGSFGCSLKLTFK
jgi:hypothetical protein